MSTHPDLTALVADAFDLGDPTGPLQPVRRGSQETWWLDTTSGSVLVKRFCTGEQLAWQAELADAMAAGIDAPPPIRPREPQFGVAAHIYGHGVFRAYSYLQHRPLQAGDDVADWVGATLARIYLLRPPLATTPAATERRDAGKCSMALRFNVVFMELTLEPVG